MTMNAALVAVTGLCLVALAALVVVLVTLRREPRPGRWGLVTCALGLGIWCSALAAQYLITDPDAKKWMASPVYLGICVAVVGFARWMIDMVGRPRVAWWGWIIVAVPGLISAILLASPWSETVLRNVVAEPKMGPTVSESGPWFFIHTVWAYSLILGSLLVFTVVVVMRAPMALRRPAYLVPLAAGVPLLANVVFLSELIPTNGYDPTPFSLLASLLGVWWVIGRARIHESQLGLVTVARDRVVDSMRDPVFTLDASQCILDMNPAACLMVGHETPRFGAAIHELLPDWPSREDCLEDSAHATFEHEERTFDIACTRVSDRKDGVMVAVLRDTTLREHAERTHRQEAVVNHHRATHDDLTGLPNRQAVFMSLGFRMNDTPMEPFSLMVLDLDGFKALNDSFGHRTGDNVLRELSHRLARAHADTAMVARLGGDEFAIISDVVDQAEVELIAQRLLETVRIPFRLEGTEIPLGASVGIAIAPDHGEDPDTLMHAADVAMYDAKREGRDVAMYTLTEDRRQPGWIVLGGELRKALTTGTQVEVHYQPQHAACGKMVGIEALVRWRHPTRGLLLPGQFLPLAEESNLIRALTDRILEQAVADAVLINQAHENIRVSVNISERDLRDPRLVDRVSSVLDGTHLDPSLLTLEVTENALITAAGSTTDQLHGLRDLGVNVSLDDFGTGIAPLSTLRTVHVDELKIDRSFVSGMSTTEVALVRSLVNLGHDLGLVVVAEGVETEQERDLLSDLGCDVLQGYLFGRPMPFEQLPSPPETTAAGVSTVTNRRVGAG